MGTILALDVASTTGICYGDPANGAPTFLHEKFTKPGESADYLDALTAGRRAQKWFLDFVRVANPELVVIEAPVSAHALAGQTSEWSTQLKFTLLASLGVTAMLWGLPVRLGKINTVRKHFIGEGRTLAQTINGKKIGGGELAKRKCFAVCQAIGWTPHTHDEADAGALFHYQAHLMSPGSVPRVDPLFLQNLEIDLSGSPRRKLREAKPTNFREGDAF